MPARATAASTASRSESLFTHLPGLIVAYPSTAADAKGMLKSAIRSDDPVLFCESQGLYAARGPVPEGDVRWCRWASRPWCARAAMPRIVAWGPAVPDALKAAEELAGEGIECEVIDLRTLVPLDMETVLASVRKTGRCVVAAQAVPQRLYVNEIVARVVAEAFDDLDAPVARIGAANGISPQAEGLEQAFLPNAGDIANGREGAHLMATPILMPMPGQMTEECTVLQWLKAEGDTIAKGDPLFEIETDKSNMEIEAFDEGTLLRIDAPEGATVPVESIVAWIGTPGDELPERGGGRRHAGSSSARGGRGDGVPGGGAGGVSSCRNARSTGTVFPGDPATRAAHRAGAGLRRQAQDQPAGQSRRGRARGRPTLGDGHRPRRPHRGA